MSCFITEIIVPHSFTQSQVFCICPDILLIIANRIVSSYLFLSYCLIVTTLF